MKRLIEDFRWLARAYDRVHGPGAVLRDAALCAATCSGAYLLATLIAVLGETL